MLILTYGGVKRLLVNYKSGCSLLIFLDSHFFDKSAQTLIVLGLTDRTGGKECVEQFLLTTEQLLLLFSRG